MQGNIERLVAATGLPDFPYLRWALPVLPGPGPVEPSVASTHPGPADEPRYDAPPVVTPTAVSREQAREAPVALSADVEAAPSTDMPAPTSLAEFRRPYRNFAPIVLPPESADGAARMAPTDRLSGLGSARPPAPPAPERPRPARAPPRRFALLDELIPGGRGPDPPSERRIGAPVPYRERRDPQGR